MVDDLREELRLRGLPSSGPKPALMQRLLEAVEAKPDIPLGRMVRLLYFQNDNFYELLFSNF
jgi:hypothetical protein